MNGVCSDTSHILKHFFWNVSSYNESILSLERVREAQFLLLKFSSPMFSKNRFKTQHIVKMQPQIQCHSWFCWTFQEWKSLCLYLDLGIVQAQDKALTGTVFRQTLTLSAIYLKTLWQQPCDIMHVHFDLAAARWYLNSLNRKRILSEVVSIWKTTIRSPLPMDSGQHVSHLYLPHATEGEKFGIMSIRNNVTLVK